KTYNNNLRTALADERAKEFYALIEQGVPVKEIAQTYDLASGSVYQIIERYAERYGLPKPDLRGAMRETADGRAEKFRFMKLQGATLEDIGGTYGLTRE